MEHSTDSQAGKDLALREEERKKAHQVRQNIKRGRDREPYTLKEGDIIHGNWQVDKISDIDYFEVKTY